MATDIFTTPSPYLSAPRQAHATDYKFSRYNSLLGKSSAEAKHSTNSNGHSFVNPDGTIGVILFGLGRAGMIHLGNLMTNPRVQLHYIVESSQERYDSVKRHWTTRTPPLVSPEKVETALKDPRVGAVVVATPTFTHQQIILTSLEAGKMVFCEKPVSENAEQTALCFRRAKELNLSIFCAFNRRFEPAFRSVRDAVRSGAIGKAHVIKTVARDSPLPSLEYLKISGGIFHDCAVHDIDLICWVLGEFPRRVYATGNAHIPEIAALDDLDTVAITLEFANGTLGTIDISRNAVYGYDQRLEVFGPAGMLVAGNERPMNVRHVTDDGDTATPIYHSFPSRYSESYLAEMEAFLDHVQGKCDLPILPEDSMKVSKVASACEEAAKTGAAVTIEYD